MRIVVGKRMMEVSQMTTKGKFSEVGFEGGFGRGRDRCCWCFENIATNELSLSAMEMTAQGARLEDLFPSLTNDQ